MCEGTNVGEEEKIVGKEEEEDAMEEAKQQ